MLSGFQKQKLLNHFNMYDFDSNGVLEKTDFEQFVISTAKARGWEADSPEYKELYHTFVESRWRTLQNFADANKDNEISLDEYFEYIDNLLNTPELYAEEITGTTQAVFDSFDTNRDGQIDLAEYKLIYKGLGLDEKFAPVVFNKLDLNGDQYISKDEFVELVDQFFKSKDPEAPGNWFFGPIS